MRATFHRGPPGRVSVPDLPAAADLPAADLPDAGGLPDAAGLPGTAGLPGAAGLLAAVATLTLVAGGSVPARATTPAAVGPTPPSASTSADTGLAVLEAEIRRLGEIGGGTLGVGIHHLESGRRLMVNGDEPFPMASTYKVPIAVQLLTRVERGELTLDSLVAVQPGDLHPGSGTLTELFDDPGVVLSARNLLELMLLISDNSATDLVLGLAGGPDAVTVRMHELGIQGLRVDRSTAHLIAHYIGVEEPPPPGEFAEERWEVLFDEVSEEEREEARERFRTDPRDTSTPAAMTELLGMIWRGAALDSTRTALLLDVLQRVRTGRNRLKGLLPPGTTVYHKTGTVGPTTNDVGIVELPEDRGHVVVAAFVRDSERDVEDRERAIAQVARAAYDYFLFTSPTYGESELRPGGAAGGR